MLGAVESFCLTPIIIAFHRFIILDEVAPGYVVDPGHPGFMAFFGWLVALSILRELVVLAQETLTALGVPDARRLGRRDCPVATADHFVSGARCKCAWCECAQCTG